MPVSTCNPVLLHDAANQCWLRFRELVDSLSVTALDAVIPALETIERRVSEEGLYAAGFVSYEASPAFDSALSTHPSTDFPLLWFGLYRHADVFSFPNGMPPVPAPELQPSVTQDEYSQAIRQVRDFIAAGETYQVNYSFRLRGLFSEDPWALFAQLIRAQGAGYGAYIDTGDWVLCSASPELFFERSGSRLFSKPMKGTIARGLWPARDRGHAAWLAASDKNRAENVMIVDMVRNDMGRIAEAGSVHVPALFALEQYPTVWQMTSTVECRSQASLAEIFGALFPAASITGAPKVHTMSLITELETSPRQIYTGTIGFLSPDGRAQFNVAIRTALLDRRSGLLEYGVGGGIVWDSVDESELEECYAKAAVLRTPIPDFSFLESILWEPPSGYFLLDRHIERLSASADYFGIPFDPTVLIDRLAALAPDPDDVAHKVRILVDRAGGIDISTAVLTPLPSPARLCFAREPVDRASPFLYHKTTHRGLYNDAKAAHPDYDDVILWNEAGEITESCIANVVVDLGGRLYTPPIGCGLLAGTFRDQLLAEGRLEERVLYRDDLEACTRIYLINSVRKWREAILV